jgi:hypothetical protein
MRRNWIIVPVLLILATAAMAAPAVYWASDPVRPGETVLACGSGFGAKPSVAVGRLNDKPAGLPPASKALFPTDARPATLYQPGDESVKFALPADLKPGVFAYRLTGAGGEVSGLLNAPAVWWAQGDRGVTASPGGWVGAFGRNLAPGATPGTIGYLTGPRNLTLKVTEAECWSARFALPGNLPAGEYKLYVHNGYGGPAGWSQAVKVTVAVPVAWSQTRLNVLDFGADGGGNRDDTASVQAALAAAEANGGGVVYFPRGRYRLTEALTIPRKTVLRGESSTLTCLFWPDMEKPPKALISGSNSFGLEDLTFYTFNYTKFLTADRSGPEAGDVFCHRLVVRANAYRGHMKPEEFDKRWREGLKDGFGGGYWLMDFGGRNIEITDCDLLSSGDVIALRNPHGARIANNILRAGRWGGSGIFEGDGVIVEHNQYLGQDLTTWGATGGAGYGNLQNVYIGHNLYRMEHGGDREAITADAPGGYYQGKPLSADATSLTVPSKPGRVDAGIFILDGEGRGQYRRIAAVEGNKMTVDRPWDVIPDASSSVSVTHLLQHWLITGNDFADVGAVQSFGVFMECVMADNVSVRQSGYRSWGLNYSDASQPTWYCQMLGNRIREGNYYHGTYGVCAVEAQIGTEGGQPDKDAGGSLLRGVIVRNNVCENNSGIGLGGTSTDVVVEGNSIAHADNGLDISGGSTGILVRGNRWESVRNPIGGEGLEKAWIEPSQRVAAIRARLQQLYEDAGLTEDPTSDKAVAAAVEQLAKASPKDAATAESAVLTAVVPRLATTRRDLPLGRVAGALGLQLNAPAAGSPVFLATPEGKAVMEFVVTLRREYAAPWTAAVAGLQLPAGWSRVGQTESVTLQPGKPTRITASVAVPADVRGRVAVPFTLAIGPAGSPLRLRSVVSLYVTGDAPLTQLDFERQAGGMYPNKLGGGFDAKVEGNVPQDSDGVGRSASFDGKSYLTLPDFSGMFPASVTVALWVKPATLGGRYGLVAKRLDNAGTPFVLTQTGDHLTFEASEANGSAWSFNFVGTTCFKADTWTHVVAVARQGYGITLYADGRKVGEKLIAAERESNSAPLVIGREAWGGPNNTPGFFQGLIDEVKVWPIALSEEQVKREYEASARPQKNAFAPPVENGRQALVRRLQTPPVIDGKLDEWPLGDPAQALRLEQSFDATPSAGPPSEAWLGYDKEALYVALRHSVNNAAALKNSGQTWGRDEGMELAIQDATGKDAPIFDLYGYPNGSFVSVTAAGASAEAAGKLGAATTYRAVLGSNAWTCEWRLPFAALGISPESKPRVLFNLGVRKTDPDSWVIWRGTGPIWRVENAGELVFAS